MNCSLKEFKISVIANESRQAVCFIKPSYIAQKPWSVNVVARIGHAWLIFYSFKTNFSFGQTDFKITLISQVKFLIYSYKQKFEQAGHIKNYFLQTGRK